MGRDHVPGVEIRELPDGPPPIRSAPTTVTALLGTGRGSAVRVTSMAAPTAATGALKRAVHDFFAAGGEEAWVVPVALTPSAAADAVERLDADVALVGIVGDPAPDAAVVAAAATAARRRRAMLVAECPGSTARAAADAVAGFRAAAGADAANLALYWPRLRSGRGADASPVGSVTGAIVANDRARGVARAAANIALRTGDPAAEASTPDRSALAEAGVNLIAAFPGRGTLLWGTRTVSADREWRYVPVRRLALHLEESISRGLRWAVFEPNDEPLWAQVRLSVESFLVEQWRSGAFVGDRPEEAFFVRCGRDTMTQDDIDDGALVCVVGFAPVKPAEFLILRIRTVAEPPR